MSTAALIGVVVGWAVLLFVAIAIDAARENEATYRRIMDRHSDTIIEQNRSFIRRHPMQVVVTNPDGRDVELIIHPTSATGTIFPPSTITWRHRYGNTDTTGAE